VLRHDLPQRDVAKAGQVGRVDDDAAARVERAGCAHADACDGPPPAHREDLVDRLQDACQDGVAPFQGTRQLRRAAEGMPLAVAEHGTDLRAADVDADVG